MRIIFYLNLFIFLSLSTCQTKSDKSTFSSADWAFYQGDLQVSQYKDFTQINTENVPQLEQAWVYHTQDADSNDRSQIQCNPLIIDGVLYGTSAGLKIFALNAATGEQLWEFDPFGGNFAMFGSGVNRGLNFWRNESEDRLLYACGSKLYALNPQSGSLIKTFGEDGIVDLKQGLGRNVDSLFLSNNSPGIIYNNLLILGSRVSESTGPVPGHLRAFDVISGEIAWTFHTIPYPGEFGHDTWPENAYLKSGGANTWAGFSLDKERGIVYAPTGSASFDFYGGDRIGTNLFANCIVALNAETGERIWHYQTIHHDLWDRDLPAPPNLVTIEKDGKKIDALAQISKSGYLFVLNRETGEPLFPIEEKKVAASVLDGESAWPTQPIPTGYPPFCRTTLEESDLANRNPEAAAYAKAIWEESKGHNPFSPPNENTSILFPGFDGGGEWGGAAYDPETSTMYINSNEIPWQMKMNAVQVGASGQKVYQLYCQGCHGQDLQGSELKGNVPPLVNLKEKINREQAQEIIQTGKGVMPSFATLKDSEVDAMLNFLFEESDSEDQEVDSSWPYPYYFEGYQKLMAPDGLPMITPPWGQLTAIDLNSAKIKWQVPLGNHPKVNSETPTGVENYGGSVVTKGGLVIIAATMDEKIRAFHSQTGKLLWETDLPAAGYATPATYMVDGKQYIVIACGGGKLGTKSGDAYVAFSLP